MLQLHMFANMKTQKCLDKRWQETSLNLRKTSEKVAPADGSNDIFLNLPVLCSGTAMGDRVRFWGNLKCNVKCGHFPQKKNRIRTFTKNSSSNENKKHWKNLFLLAPSCSYWRCDYRKPGPLQSSLHLRGIRALSAPLQLRLDGQAAPMDHLW